MRVGADDSFFGFIAIGSGRGRYFSLVGAGDMELKDSPRTTPAARPVAHQRLLRKPARHEHEWKDAASSEDVYEGRERKTGQLIWTGNAVDLVSGSNSQLRGISEVYAYVDSRGHVRARLRGGVGLGIGDSASSRP